MMEKEEDASPEECVALCDFTGSGSEQLSFTAGDRLLVFDKSSADWWWAELQGVTGYAPASYLRAGTADEEEDAASMEDPWQDEEYYGSYGTLKLHLEMLSDRSRTETYRRVILSNSASLRNKVVMDLGCGTGIISMFCAQLAKPSAVYAVEASSMADYTGQLVKQNGCEDVVTVMKGRAEELELPQQVDVLFEFMVESVLVARDRWLKDGGVLWPSSAALTLVPCQASSYYAEKMPLAQEEFFNKPKFSHIIEPDDCLAAPCDVISMDMYALQVRDLEEMKGDFHFSVIKSGVFHGFTAWFSVHFESLETGGATVELNTGPNSEPTHWKQTLFMLDKPVSVFSGDSIAGTIDLRRNPVWRRHMTVTLQWNVNGQSWEKKLPNVEVTD
ncbi:Protein arginine N-methyltransferase 2 [Oryzias melastigma]|uniref:Protein arginine N-methyltransferase 2 n=1 Tax=Oryzias melastigma TaxID=30732 RepID=A0A834EUW2_ORYME|nr:Protein arginine N-methyltransferase 2 [Oryzias melastigma]